MKNRQRVKCLNCNRSYITNLRKKKSPPRRCKFCGSSMLFRVNIWRVH